MAAHTINGQAWPSGTLVSVYPAEALPAGGTAPAGTAVTSATVVGASVAFSGLTEGRRYIAYAVGKAVGFLVQPGSVDTLRPISGSEAQAIRDSVDVVEGKVPAEQVDQTAASIRDVLTLRPDSKWGAAPAADVLVNSLNFPGLDPTGVASSGAALDAAVAACIPATDPATTTRNATRRLHVPPGTYMRNDGQPVLSLRSVQGFNLRSGGPSAVRFRQGATSRAVVEFNGVSRSHFDGFSFDTSGSPIVDKGVWIYWDNTPASPTQAARSTLESRFEFIEGGGNDVIVGMQLGRDGDNNQVDSLSFGHVMLQASNYAFGLGTVTLGSSNITGVTQTAGVFTPGHEIVGQGIPAGTRVRSFAAGTIVMEDAGGALVNGTITTAATSLRSQSPALSRVGLKVGHGVFANNLLHNIHFLATMGWNDGLMLARSGLTVTKWQPQANGCDLWVEGPPNGEAKILSGRSETSQRFIRNTGFGSAVGFLTVEDMKYAANVLHGDGKWIDYHTPGIFRVNNVFLQSPLAGVVPSITCSPTRRMNFMSQGLSSEQPATTALTLGVNVAGSVDGYLETAAGAVPAGSGIPVVTPPGTTLTLPPVDFVQVAGNGNLLSISTGGHLGKRRTIQFTGTASGTGLTAGSNIKIPANFVYTPNDTYELYCDGTNWYACGPGSVNP